MGKGRFDERVDNFFHLLPLPGVPPPPPKEKKKQLPKPRSSTQVINPGHLLPPDLVSFCLPEQLQGKDYWVKGPNYF